jgi:hypothetical protein
MKGDNNMSCKSGIYVVNTTTGTSIGIGGTYVPSTIIRRYGKYCQLSGNGVSIGNACGGAGYYDVNASVAVVATAIGNVTATLYKDGAPVQGATAIATATAIGNIVTLPISALVRLNCDCDTANLTIVIGGQAVTAQNLAFVVEKI